MRKEEILLSICAKFIELGAPADVARQLQEQHTMLRCVYDKFNCWAYAQGEDVHTTWSFKNVSRRGQTIKAEVYLSRLGFTTRAAVVRCSL